MRFETTVVVVDDHPMFRSGVVETIGAADDLSVVGQASTAAEAVATIRSNRPDIVLLDLALPGGGFEVVRVVHDAGVKSLFVVVTASEDENDLREALELGVRAYVLKGVSGPELVDIVRRVRRGKTYVTPTLATRTLFSQHSLPADRPFGAGISELTPRELEVLDLLGEAHSNKEIAAKLEISVKTVKHHVTNIMGKLNARNRVEAALMLRRLRKGSPTLKATQPHWEPGLKRGPKNRQ